MVRAVSLGYLPAARYPLLVFTEPIGWRAIPYLEAIVFGRRIVDRIHSLPAIEGSLGRDVKSLSMENQNISRAKEQQHSKPVSERRLRLQKMMVRQVGLRRKGIHLQQAVDKLHQEMSF